MAYIELKRISNHFMAYVDSEYIGPIYKSDAVKFDIPESGDIPESSVMELRNIIYKRAANKAMNILAVREASKGDIISKLKLKNYTESTISDVIDMLYFYNYLDDRRYIESFVRSNMEKKSRSLIRQELSMKNVDMSLVDEIIDKLFFENDIDADTIIRETIEKKFSGQDFSDEKVKRRIIAYMSRRGFNPGEVYRFLT